MVLNTVEKRNHLVGLLLDGVQLAIDSIFHLVIISMDRALSLPRTFWPVMVALLHGITPTYVRVLVSGRTGTAGFNGVDQVLLILHASQL